MAYPSDKNDQPLQFLRMGGLNQRVSKHVLPAPEFSVLQGLYPAQDGILERLPGIRPLALFGDSTAAVWNIFQPNDGTDNIIVQTSDGTERTATLNELFGRPVISSLIYTPVQDDANMPTAQLIQDAANGVDGGNIGANSNTWYVRELTSNPLNESSIVVSFTAGAAADFTLAPGTYRIDGFVSAAFTVDQPVAAADTVVCSFQAVLNNVTDGVTTVIGSPVTSNLSRNAGDTSDYTWGPKTLYSNFDDTFVVSGSNKTFDIRNIYVATASNGSTVITRVTGKAAGATAVLNGAAVRQPYVKINLRKVA
jgi:hypothetical protein